MIQIHNDSETEKQISQCFNVLRKIFREDLLGVYLYGSAVTGGLQAFSDIDLFVILNRAMTITEKAKLLGEILKISGIYQKSQKRPIELIIVLKSKINPWTYPPHFEYQYGDWLREKFESGNLEPWTNTEMPDLALLITQVLLANKTLVGPSPEKLLSKVPYQDVLRATEDSLASLIENLDHDTRNVLLTYARIWAMLMTDAMYSKPEAALWALDKLPKEYKPVMNKARAICIGEEPEDWTKLIGIAQHCTKYMKKEIEKLLEFRSHNNSDLNLRIQGGIGDYD